MKTERFYWTKNVLIALSLAAITFMGFKFIMETLIIPKQGCVSLITVNGVREYENTECGQ